MGYQSYKDLEIYQRIKYQASRIQDLGSRKGVALIIVIFAMMLFAVLGWTLAVMLSTDFEANLRNIDSERALGLAEAGAQWGLRRLKDGFNCSNFEPNGSPPGILHELNFGQYRVTCDCTDNPPQCNNSPELIIESLGYVPLEGDFRAQRQVRMTVNQGALSRAGSVRNLFDWSGILSGSDIDGDLGAGCFDGPDLDNSCPGIAGVDYGANLPPGDGSRTQGATTIPTIDMVDFENNASNIWSPPRTAVITNISVSAGRSTITVDDNIFPNPKPQWDGQAVRNVTEGSWGVGNWEIIYDTETNSRAELASVVDWQEGDRVTVVPKISSIINIDIPTRTYTIKVNCDIFPVPFPQWYGQVMRNFTGATWGYRDWGVIQDINSVGGGQRIRVTVDNSVDLSVPGNLWAVNDWLGVVKLFSGNNNNQGLWYINGDVLIDTRTENAQFKKTSLVVEGDIVMRGSKRLSMDAYVEPSTLRTFPNLATENGNIYSPDAPDAGSGGREFKGLIYTNLGNVLFNYIDGTAIIGDNLTLRGEVELDYDAKYLDATGFLGTFSILSWQEQ